MKTPLTTAQVAERLAIKEEQIRTMIRRGVLPAFKAGLKVWRVEADALEAFIKSRSNQKGAAK